MPYDKTFKMPTIPEGLPKEAVDILSSTYSNIRQKWTEENPKDPENEENKKSAASIAWAAVKKQYKKNEEGKWLKKDSVDNKDNIEEDESEIEGIDFSASDIIDSSDNYISGVQHYDVFDDTKRKLTTKMAKRADGSLSGKTIVTNIGVFMYRQKDGTIMREARYPEDVFDEASLETLKNIPITNSHPDPKKHKDGLVSKYNESELKVGYNGDDVEHDPYAVSITTNITDKKAVDDVEAGKDMFSLGYKADLEMKPGVLLGVPYDARQRNIRYNHNAIVPKARAGDLAKMRFDSGDSIFDGIAVSDCNDKKRGEEPMKKIIIDGVEYEAEAKAIEAYTKAKADYESIKKDNDDLKIKLSETEAKQDTFKDEADNAKKELAEKVITDEMISEAVNDRLAIISVANDLKVEVKKDGKELNNEELKKAIIMKKSPSAKLDGKDSTYINVRYDSIIDIMKDDVAANNKKKVFQSNIPGNHQDSANNNTPDNKQVTRADAYAKQCKDLEDQHKNYKGAASVN